jgi:hypothetical protein
MDFLTKFVLRTTRLQSDWHGAITSNRFGYTRKIEQDACRQSAVKRAVAKFWVDQHVRINKEKLRFATGSEQSYTIEIFKIFKVAHKTPRRV